MTDLHDKEKEKTINYFIYIRKGDSNGGDVFSFSYNGKTDIRIDEIIRSEAIKISRIIEDINKKIKSL